MKTPNEKLAERFAEENNGQVIGTTYGYTFRKDRSRSHAGVKILIDGHMIHFYTSRTWHRNKKGISMSEEQLQVALDENALIIHMKDGVPYVANAVAWEQWAREDNNYYIHPIFKKKEVFCKVDNLRVLDISKLEQYYDDYVPNESGNNQVSKTV